jgi:hypothetical protein
MKHFVLYSILLFTSLTVAQTLTQGVITLAGTVYAPEGEDVAGTVVVACFVQGSDCDESKTKTFEITESGPSASFNITGLSREAICFLPAKTRTQTTRLLKMVTFTRCMVQMEMCYRQLETSSCASRF